MKLISGLTLTLNKKTGTLCQVPVQFGKKIMREYGTKGYLP